MKIMEFYCTMIENFSIAYYCIIRKEEIRERLIDKFL